MNYLRSPVRTQVPLLSLVHHDLRPLLALPATLQSLAQIMLPVSRGDGQQRRETSVWVSWVESISLLLNTIFLSYMFSLVRCSLNYPVKNGTDIFMLEYVYICFLKEDLYIYVSIITYNRFATKHFCDTQLI